MGFLVAVREPTRRQWQGRVEETRRHCSGGAEGLPCNSWSFWGLFGKFKIVNVLFV
jgi:hypothetical protein